MKRDPTVPPAGRRALWVPTGLPAARGAAVEALEGPYLSRAPIRDSRVTLGSLSGPVVPNRGSMET